jgi:hypothetical protein
MRNAIRKSLNGWKGVGCRDKGGPVGLARVGISHAVAVLGMDP